MSTVTLTQWLVLTGCWLLIVLTSVAFPLGKRYFNERGAHDADDPYHDAVRRHMKVRLLKQLSNAVWLAPVAGTVVAVSSGSSPLEIVYWALACFAVAWWLLFVVPLISMFMIARRRARQEG